MSSALMVCDHMTPGVSYPVRGLCALDGDSVMVEYRGEDAEQFSSSRFEVRLFGIDAPEAKLLARLGQPGARASRDYLSSLVRGRVLTFYHMVLLHRSLPVKPRRGPVEFRYFPRLVGVLRRSGRSSVNYRMVRDGWARNYTQFGSLPRGRFAESLAREEGLGLWSFPEEDIRESPWEYRRRMKREEPCSSG